MRTAERPALLVYMWTVVAVGTPLVALVAGQAMTAGPFLSGRSGVVVAIFSAVLVTGEMWPIPVARGREAGDEITVSSTFGFALLFCAPVVVAVAAQAVALTIDFVVRGRRPGRLPFNIVQYALAFIGARYVYALCAHEPMTPPVHPDAPHLLAALVAACVFLLVNNVLVGLAVALSLHVRPQRVLLDDLTWQIATSAPLLGLGPLAAQAMSWTPFSILLLLVPIAALHHSGTMAMRREQEALRDMLTGLANRGMLASETQRALNASAGETAMLLLDLDHFKEINDTLGHAVGDEMLRAVAQRLTAQAGEGDLVARLGGDEFVVLRRNVTDPDSVTELAERLCAAVREPVLLHGVTLSVGCSVGIAFGPRHATTVSELLRCADIALYTAKITRDAAVIYNKQSDRHSAALLGLQADLRSALEAPADDQFWVAYQPQVERSTGLITSVECLARWHHPELGEIPPDTFIPMAESTSSIDLLLHRVLESALAQLVAWDREGTHLRMSVNLSSRQISDITLPETIEASLQRHGIAAHRLVLEVTESRLMANPETCAHIMRRLHDLGVQISIDDFGTGYSSLAYLQHLAVDELKIDKTFTQQMHESGGATIVRSTVDLGHNLGLRVVAEGVEDRDTAEQLVGMGCDVLQGHFIGRPMSAVALSEALGRSRGLLSGDGARSRRGRSVAPALALVSPDQFEFGDDAYRKAE